MKARVTEIQIGGGSVVYSLEDACREYIKMISHSGTAPTEKIHFTIKLPSGETENITIREEDNQVIAYGSFKELPDFLDYSKEVEGETSNTE